MYNHHSIFSKQEDRCNECDEKSIKECCNKCGEGLCLRESCCQIFPHYNKELYILCNECVTIIEQKLRPTTVDKCDLRLLKQKISKRMEAKVKKLEVSERVREQKQDNHKSKSNSNSNN